MATLEVVYKFRNQAKGQVNSAKKNIEGLGDATENAAKRNASFIKGAGILVGSIAAVGVAAQQAYQLVGQGADLIAAEEKFTNLAASIGTTSDALINDMRKATSGMMSDAEIIAGATDIINLGLGKSHEQTVRLASTVGTLGLDMQQVILTFANNSKARLDALGLSISEVDQLTKEFQATGMNYDEAFDEAVLVALENKIKLLGDASETTAGQMKIVEAEMENLRNEGAMLAAVMAGPMIKSLSVAVTGQNRLNDGIAAGVITTKEWNEIVNEAEDINLGTADAIDAVNRRIEEQATGISAAEQTIISYYQGMATAKQAIDYSNDAMEEQVKLLYGTEKATRMYARTFLETSDIISDGARALGTEYTKAIEDSEDALYSWNQTMVYSGGLTGQQRTNLSELNSEQKKIEENIRSLTGGTAGLGLTTEELNDKLKKEYEQLDLVTAAMGPLMSITGEASIASEGYAINTEAVNSTFRQMVIDGGASAETVALMDVALGGYDETAIVAALNSAILSEKLGQLAEDFAGGKISAEEMQEKLQEIVNDSPYVTEAEFLNDAARQGITDIIKALDKIPRSITTKHNVTSSGSPSFPSGGGADSGSSASEGAAGGRSGVTVVGNVNITNPPTNTTTAERIGGAIQ